MVLGCASKMGGALPPAGFLFFPGQQISQFLEPRGGIHPAGGVVGRVENQRLGPTAHRPVQLGQVQVEVLGRFGHHQFAAVVVGVEAVLGEAGGDNHHLVAGIQKRFQGYVQRPARPAGHDHVVGFQGSSGVGGEVFGHPGADLGVPGVGHVAVHARGRVLGQLAQGLPAGFRGLHDRITPREKSKTLSAPTSCFMRMPSSNILRIHEALVMKPSTFFEIAIWGEML
jgi:hypothetical protein